MYSKVYWMGLALAALVPGLAGCSGPKRVDVTGQVTYNKSPLAKPGGTIVFVGPDGSQTVASISPDGTYRASQVPVGLNQVAVSYPNPNAKFGKQVASRSRKSAPPPPPTTPPPEPFLTPARYASVTTSELSVQVETGTVFNPDLTGPPIP